MIDSTTTTAHAQLGPVPSEHRVTTGARRAAATEIPNGAGDAVELSPAARSTDDQARAQRVREIRRQIAAGTYLTEDKVNATVQLLHDALFASGRDLPSQRVAS